MDLSGEILQAVLAGIDEGIHVVDTEGNTIYYNEIAAGHDGLSVNEVLNKPLLEVFPSLNKSTSTLLKVMKTKQPIYNQLQVYTNFYGKKIETINTTLPIFANNRLSGAIEIAKDYTTIKRLSEQLIDLQKKMLPLKENTRKRTVKYTLTDFLTQNPYLIALKKEAEQLSKTQSSILVFGESGTGKEIFVQGIHNASSRSQGPFIAQNCAAIPEALLESILFGTAKGSYTGALDRPGLFELANGGTLFLDEIHEMPVDLQVKLLRVLEDGVVLRVGGVKSFFVDVRVIAAMNVHPKQAIEEKRLRPDLFYRLNVLTFELLPLRKRREDILYLTKNLITEFNMLFHKKVFGVDKDVEGLFLRYSWPGNVRELKHTIEYMMNICEESVLTKQVLPVMLKEQISGGTESSSGEDRGHVPFREMMELYERKLIEKALGSADGNIKKAAERLEIPRQTLQYKLKKYKLKDAK